MKKTVLMALTLSAAACLASCGSSDSSSSSKAETTTTSAATETAATTESVSETEGTTSASITKDENGYTRYPTPADPADLTGVDFSAPDIKINAGEYDKMLDTAKQIQNYALEGVVIEIDGVVNSGMSHSINVQNSDASKMIGTTIQVVGFEDSDYPADKTSVHIVGIIRPINEYAHGIIIANDNFKVNE